jgi:hypothetical protein
MSVVSLITLVGVCGHFVALGSYSPFEGVQLPRSHKQLSRLTFILDLAHHPSQLLLGMARIDRG